VTTSDRTGVFAFRLSCNCLVSFYLPPKAGTEVMCQDCKKEVAVTLRYPSLSSTCGALGKDGKTLLRCTLPRKHAEAYHYDGPLERDFTTDRKLRSSNEGNTARA
jgi:hypothetical protein